MIRVRGFSLVELMVAVTLALIVTAAVVSVFGLATRSAYQSTTGTAAVSDGGRFALDFIAGSVRGAGFMAWWKVGKSIEHIESRSIALVLRFHRGAGRF